MAGILTRILVSLWLVIGVLFLVFPRLAKGFVSFLFKRHINKTLLAIAFLVLATTFDYLLKKGSLVTFVMFFVFLVALFRVILEIRKKVVRYVNNYLDKISIVWYRVFGGVVGFIAYFVLRQWR